METSSRVPAPDGTGKGLGFSASYDVTWGLSFHVCETGILLSSPSFTTMGKKCDNTLQMAYYNTNYEIRYDDDNDDDENDVRLFLFVQQKNYVHFFCAKHCSGFWSYKGEQDTHGSLPDGARCPAGRQTQGS